MASEKITEDFTKWSWPIPNFEVTARFEGHIECIEKDYIGLRTFITISKEPDNGEYYMEYSLEEIPESEKEYIQEGSYFRWYLGEEDDDELFVINKQTMSQEEFDECQQDAHELWQGLK